MVRRNLVVLVQQPHPFERVARLDVRALRRVRLLHGVAQAADLHPMGQ